MAYKKFQINRILVVEVMFGIIFLVLIARLFYLQVIEYNSYFSQAREQHFGSIKIPAKRGEILLQDPSSGNPYKIATNTTLDLLYVDPFLLKNESEVADKLAPIVYEGICQEKSDRECVTVVQQYVGISQAEENNSNNDISKIKPEEWKKEDRIREIRAYIYKKIREKEVTSVLLKRFVNTDEPAPEDDALKAKVQGYGFDGIYVEKTGIYANPVYIQNKEGVAAKLAQDVNLSYDELVAKLTRRSLRYLPLVRKLSTEQSRQIKALGINGVVLLPEHWRYYPEKNFASSVIGFFDTFGVGQYGIEGKFDSILRGVEGEIESENDLLGRNLVMQKGTIKTAQEGSSIVLTLERVLQSEVEKKLEKAVEAYRATSGQVVIMDPFTGNILAMANYPSFDPNKYSDVYKTKEISFDPGKTMTVIKKLENGKFLTYVNKFGPLVFVNHTISSLYEPGSIFKPLTVAAGIDSKEITPQTMYLDKGEIDVDEYTIHNVSQACLGYHDMINALNFSCNIGMVTIAKKLGKSLFYHYITRFGFGERTDIELDGEAKGVVKYYRNWAASNLATIAFGQGISMTPLQIVTAFSSLANGGLLLTPHIVKEIRRPEGEVEKTGVDIVRRVISKETADTLISMMIGAVENGVAKNGRVDRYRVAGKTGTAQIPLEGRAGFEEGEGTTIASFIGILPASSPKFVVLVKLDRPRSSQWADSTAAPLFKEIATFLMSYYNIPPDR